MIISPKWFIALRCNRICAALLADDNKFGFIVMDGNGALFGTLQGNSRDVLHKFTVDLPKKHGKIAVFHIIFMSLILRLLFLRQRRSVGASFCPITNGEAAQLRA